MRVKKNLVLLLLIIGLLISGNLKASDEYYVNPSGSDVTGDGSISDPWKTIEWAVDHVSNPTAADIIIHVSGDTYDLWNGSATDPINIKVEFNNLTIEGEGSGTTIVQAHTDEGSATDRVFKIYNGGTVTLKDMTIRNGKSNYGGGIWNRESILTMTNCTVSENTSPTEEGGGIWNYSATLTMTNCSIHGNSAKSYGGGIYNCHADAELTMTNCTVSDNTVYYGVGGGIENQLSSTVTMTNCTISGNTTDYSGGGIHISDGTVTLTNCTLANNTCGWHGGGIYIDGTVTLTNCTLANNTCGSSSTYHGGGIYNEAYLYIKNTIIANNNNSNGPFTDYYYPGSGTVTDNGYNIVENGDISVFNGTGSITGEQANLYLSSTLEANNTTNGTYTLKTTSGSVAIDNGSDSGDNNGVAIPSHDQRGANRNGTTDIGAYEYWSDEGALAVELISLTVHFASGTVALKWKTASEVGGVGFIIERRSAEKGNWEQISSYRTNKNLVCLNNQLVDTEYTFTDNNVRSGTTYFYRLSDEDIFGNVTTLDIIKISLGSLPEKTELTAAYPNPFNPQTKICYNLAEDVVVDLQVHNVLGQKVRKLLSGVYHSAGSYNIYWKGKDDSGKMMSSGTYIVVLKAGDYVRSEKVLLLR